MLRMCESLTEKCFADLLQKTLQDGNLDENEIKNYYELSQNDEKELLQAVAQKTAESGAE